MLNLLSISFFAIMINGAAPELTQTTSAQHSSVLEPAQSYCERRLHDGSDTRRFLLPPEDDDTYDEDDSDISEASNLNRPLWPRPQPLIRVREKSPSASLP
jgi:hypothetical protein